MSRLSASLLFPAPSLLHCNRTKTLLLSHVLKATSSFAVSPMPNHRSKNNTMTRFARITVLLIRSKSSDGNRLRGYLPSHRCTTNPLPLSLLHHEACPLSSLHREIVCVGSEGEMCFDAVSFCGVSLGSATVVMDQSCDVNLPLSPQPEPWAPFVIKAMKFAPVCLQAYPPAW